MVLEAARDRYASIYAGSQTAFQKRLRSRMRDRAYFILYDFCRMHQNLRATLDKNVDSFKRNLSGFHPLYYVFEHDYLNDMALTVLA